MTLALGFGAAALIKPGEIIASNKAGNTAAPSLALHLGGVDSNWGSHPARHHLRGSPSPQFSRSSPA